MGETRGVGLVVYGVDGVGKTTLALQAAKPLTLISIGECGYEDLSEVEGEIPEGCENINCDSYPVLLDILKESVDQKTVVLDSLSGFQTAFFDYVTSVLYEGNKKKFMAYSDGLIKGAPSLLPEFLEVLDDLRNAGVNVILIAHCKTKTVNNPMGENYDSYLLDISDGIGSMIRKWAQAILFLNVEMNEKREEVRFMYTTKSPAHSAKNRMQLPSIISLDDSAAAGFSNFVKYLSPVHKASLNG